jgi:hypothetical protein
VDAYLAKAALEAGLQPDEFDTYLKVLTRFPFHFSVSIVFIRAHSIPPRRKART